MYTKINIVFNISFHLILLQKLTANFFHIEYHTIIIMARTCLLVALLLLALTENRTGTWAITWHNYTTLRVKTRNEEHRESSLTQYKASHLQFYYMHGFRFHSWVYGPLIDGKLTKFVHLNKNHDKRLDGRRFDAGAWGGGGRLVEFRILALYFYVWRLCTCV